MEYGKVTTGNGGSLDYSLTKFTFNNSIIANASGGTVSNVWDTVKDKDFIYIGDGTKTLGKCRLLSFSNSQRVYECNTVVNSEGFHEIETVKVTITKENHVSMMYIYCTFIGSQHLTRSFTIKEIYVPNYTVTM